MQETDGTLAIKREPEVMTPKQEAERLVAARTANIARAQAMIDEGRAILKMWNQAEAPVEPAKKAGRPKGSKNVPKPKAPEAS